MAHTGTDPAEARRQECAAFSALAEVLQAHQAIWRSHHSVRFSLERYCDQVDRLCGTGPYAQRAVVLFAPSEWEDHKASVLLTLLQRMEALVDFIEDPRSTYQHAAALLPSRAALPIEAEGIVAFCREVHTRLLPVPGATTVRGGFASRMRNLNASLTLYANYERYGPEGPQRGTNGIDHYDQRRARCLHLLLEQVDAQMVKLARHITFQDAYHEARTVLMRLTVGARAAYFTQTGPAYHGSDGVDPGETFGRWATA